MALARWQATIVDEAGNVQTAATVTVRSEALGNPLASLFSDRAGLVPIGNPVTSDADGAVGFYVIGGAYQIEATKGAFSRTWRYVGIGTAAENDATAFQPANPFLDAFPLPNGSPNPSLGSDTAGWANLFIAAEGSIDFGSGDAAIVHVLSGSPEVGSLAITGASLSLTGGDFSITRSNAGMELGNPGASNTPYLDFHSSGNVVDYDTRLIASGGDATLGGGLLSLTGRFAINPRAASLHRGYVVTQSGAGSSAGNFAFNDIRIDEDHVDGGAGASKIDALQIVHLFGSSSMRGGRHGLEVTSVLNSASHASNPDRNYVGAAFTALANSADGGGSGTEKGAFFGINAQAAAFTGATFLLNLSAAEFNTVMQTGTSVKYKSCIQLAGRDDDVVQGTTYDCLLALSNQTTAVKWKDGILVGDMNGSFPIATTGAVMRAISASTVATGIDISALTITGNAFASPAVTISGAGAVRAGSLSVPSSLPINCKTVASVNFNSANSDTSLAILLPPGYTRYRVNQIILSGASASISTATWGLFTAAAGGGTAIFAAGQATGVTTASENTSGNMNVVGPGTINSQSYNASTLFFRVGTAQGSAATATVTITYTPVS